MCQRSGGKLHGFFYRVYEAIRHDRPLPVTAVEAVRIIRVIEKAYESVEKDHFLSWK